ncbi:MAG: SURF1 family protein [Micavibrio sp.]
MKKPPLWATLFTIFGVLILCGLGTWQVKRLHWKEALLQNIDATYQIDPLSNPQTIETLNAATLRKELYLRGSVRGQFLKDKYVRSSPRPLDGKPGNHLYMPLQLEGGGTVLVNRGWVPAGPLAVETPDGTITVAGLFKEPGKGNIFTPPNIPEQRAWYKMDLAQIADVKGLSGLSSYVLYAESGGNADTPPIPIDVRVAVNNNHLAYAIFWFTMAGVLLVIYVLRFIVRERKAAQP